MRTKEEKKEISRKITEELIKQFFSEKRTDKIDFAKFGADYEFLSDDYLFYLDKILKQFTSNEKTKGLISLGVSTDFLNKHFKGNNDFDHEDVLGFMRDKVLDAIFKMEINKDIEQYRNLTEKLIQQYVSEGAGSNVDTNDLGVDDELLKKYSIDVNYVLNRISEGDTSLGINTFGVDLEALRIDRGSNFDEKDFLTFIKEEISTKRQKKEKPFDGNLITDKIIDQLFSLDINGKLDLSALNIESDSFKEYLVKHSKMDVVDFAGEYLDKLYDVRENHEYRAKKIQSNNRRRYITDPYYKVATEELKKVNDKIYCIEVFLGLEDNEEKKLSDLLRENITVLSLNGNKLSQIGFITDYFDVISLGIADNQLTSIDECNLSALKHLENLQAGGNNFKDLSRFPRLDNLREVDFSNPNLTEEELSFIIDACRYLEKLTIIGVKKPPIKAMAQHPYLQLVDARNSPNVDLSGTKEARQTFFRKPLSNRELRITQNLDQDYSHLKTLLDELGIQLTFGKRQTVIGSVVSERDNSILAPHRAMSDLGMSGVERGLDSSHRASITLPHNTSSGRISPVAEEGSPESTESKKNRTSSTHSKSSGTSETSRASSSVHPLDSLSSHPTDSLLSRPERRGSNESSNSQNEVAAALGGPPTNQRDDTSQATQESANRDTLPKSPARSASPSRKN